MMNEYYMECCTVLPAINEIFPQFNHRTAATTIATTEGVAGNFIISPLDLSLRPGTNLVPITPPTTPTPITTSIATTLTLPFTSKRQRLMSNENHLWRPHVLATQSVQGLQSKSQTVITTTVTNKGAANATSIATTIATTIPLEYSHIYLPSVNLPNGKRYTETGDTTLKRCLKSRREIAIQGDGAREGVGEEVVEEIDAVGNFQKHRYNNSNNNNRKLPYNRVNNFSEIPESQQAVITLRKEEQQKEEVKLVSIKSDENNGQCERDEWQKLQQQPIFVDDDGDDNEDDNKGDNDDDASIILTEDESNENKEAAEIAEEVLGEGTNGMENFYEGQYNTAGQKDNVTDYYDDDKVNTQQYNKPAVAKESTQTATAAIAIINCVNIENNNSGIIVNDNCSINSYNVPLDNKQGEEPEKGKQEEEGEIDIEIEEDEYVDILSNDDDDDINYQYFGLNGRTRCPNDISANTLLKLQSQADFERELENSGKVLTRNKLFYDDEELHLNAINGLDRLFNKNFLTLHSQSVSSQKQQQQQQKQKIKDRYNNIGDIDECQNVEIYKEKTYIDLTNCRRPKLGDVSLREQRQSTATIAIDDGDRDCFITESTSLASSTTTTSQSYNLHTVTTIPTMPFNQISSLSSSTLSSSSSYRTYKTERKRIKLRRQNGLDEETISPVSGTIIRKLRDDEELVVRKGDIDPAFNVVEVTEEAKAILASIDNKIGAYLCQLCRTVYDDAFKLAQHRCPRIVHIEYKCTECDKVFNCPANLASHRRWHKPKSELMINNQVKKRLNPEIFSLQNNQSVILEKSLRDEGIFPCTQCGKSFRRLAYLKKHQTSHQMLESLKSLEFFRHPSNDFQQIHVQNTQANVGVLNGNRIGISNIGVTNGPTIEPLQRSINQSSNFVNYPKHLNPLNQLNASVMMQPVRSFGVFPFAAVTNAVTAVTAVTATTTVTATVSNVAATSSNVNINFEQQQQQQRRFYTLSELYLSQQLERSRSSAFHQVQAVHHHYRHLNTRAVTNCLPMPSSLMMMSLPVK